MKYLLFWLLGQFSPTWFDSFSVMKHVFFTIFWLNVGLFNIYYCFSQNSGYKMKRWRFLSFYFEGHGRKCRVNPCHSTLFEGKRASETCSSWTHTSGPEPGWDRLQTGRGGGWGTGARSRGLRHAQVSPWLIIPVSPGPSRAPASSGPGWRRKPASSTTWRTRRPPTWSGSACPRSASPWQTLSRWWTNPARGSSSSPWMLTSGESRDRWYRSERQSVGDFRSNPLLIRGSRDHLRHWKQF